MKATMAATVLALALSSFVFGAHAQSPPPFHIHVNGFPYASQHNGQFTMTDFQYNGKPVWTNNNWSIYFRTSGYKANRWVLDFDNVGEEWSGTVAWSSSTADAPYLSAWDKNGAVSSHSGINVANSAYSSLTTGAYALASHYDGWPVYQRTQGSSVFSIYRRSAGHAKNGWVLDFDSIDNQWSGTVDYSDESVDPTTASWKTGTFTAA